MSRSTALTVIGGTAIVIGLATIGYTHYAIRPELQRSLDIARRTADDAVVLMDALAKTAGSSAELREPAAEARRRTGAALKRAVTLLESLARTVRAVPGIPDAPADEAGDPGLRSGLSQLGRATDDLADDVQALRRALDTLTSETDELAPPPLQPVVLAFTGRVHELRDQLWETNPARNTALFSDLVAGLYLVLGTSLIVLARTA